MELQNAKKEENEKAIEASVVENEKVSGKNGEVEVEAEEKKENEVVGTSAGEKPKGDESFVETSVDANQDLATLKVPVEENKAESGTAEEPSVPSSGMKKPQGLPGKAKIVKKVKKLVKRKVIKVTAGQVAGEENAIVEQGIKEGSTVVNIKEDEQRAEPSLGESEKDVNKVIEPVADSPHCPSGKDKDPETSLGGNDKEFKKGLEELAEAPQPAADDEKVVGGEPSGKETLEEAPENALSVEKKQPRKLKAKLGKNPAQLVNTEVDKGTEGETGLVKDKKRKNKRQRKQFLGANKKPRNEVVAVSDATQQRMEERKEELVVPAKREIGGQGKVKIGGLIFMCNAKTRPDCFRFGVMGVQEKRKNYVMGIKPGLKLFLYDYDLKLLYGIFQASSVGGMKLERNAFGGSFPAQVRFKVFSDCIPLPESQFRKAIKENYNNKNKFKTELTHKQVFKLKKLFRPAALPAQVTYTQPIPVPRDADRTRSDRDRYAPGNSRTHPTHIHERRRASPPPRREEPRDLYLTEREYRTYGLRRVETTQHYLVPPPDSAYHSVNRDRVRLDSYRPSVDHDLLFRQAEIERHDRREVRLLHLPERDYHTYDHPSSRRELLGRNSPDPPASVVALDSYRRDPYYSYEYRASERPPRTYLASPRRENDDLYSRYITTDSLAEYYRSSQRCPSITEFERPPSLVASRYGYPGSLPYSHR